MKTHRKIAYIVALIATITMFLMTFFRLPTVDPSRLMGQFFGAVGVGIVVFIISYVVGALIARIKK